jgi:hypothetical protein
MEISDKIPLSSNKKKILFFSDNKIGTGTGIAISGRKKLGLDPDQGSERVPVAN